MMYRTAFTPAPSARGPFDTDDHASPCERNVRALSSMSRRELEERLRENARASGHVRFDVALARIDLSLYEDDWFR